MSVEMMRTLIQNPKTEAHYKLMTGWQRSYELVSEHMLQVIGYRDNLMAVWPPEKSKAAAAYQDRLDDLITSLNATYEASMANYDAFASATLSISLAQHNFAEIWQEHEANAAKLAEYKNDLAMSSAATFDTTPPVTSLQQEALRQRAIALMSSVSSDLAQAQLRIVRPNLYETGTDSSDGSVQNAGSTHRAPLIPPITPIFGENQLLQSNASQTYVTSPAVTGADDQPHQKVPQPPTSQRQPALVLEGAKLPGALPANPGHISVTPPMPSGDTLNPLPEHFLPGISPLQPEGFPPSTGSWVATGTPGVASGRIGQGIIGRKAMPSGGLIGGVPGSSVDEPYSSRPGIRRVNPVGGVIGEGEHGVRDGIRGVADVGAGVVPGGHPRAAASQGSGAGRRRLPLSDRLAGNGGQQEHSTSYGQTGNRRSIRREHADISRWDPDNPWVTAEGVDPVVLPPRERRIDPGPAIGLS